MSASNSRDLLEVFRAELGRRWRTAARESLAAALRGTSEPTVGNLLALLQEDAYLLERSDPITLGDVLGCEGGPKLVDWLVQLGLPLEDPVVDATAELLARPLREFIDDGEPQAKPRGPR